MAATGWKQAVASVVAGSIAGNNQASVIQAQANKVYMWEVTTRATQPLHGHCPPPYIHLQLPSKVSPHIFDNSHLTR